MTPWSLLKTERRLKSCCRRSCCLHRGRAGHSPYSPSPGCTPENQSPARRPHTRHRSAKSTCPCTTWRLRSWNRPRRKTSPPPRTPRLRMKMPRRCWTPLPWMTPRTRHRMCRRPRRILQPRNPRRKTRPWSCCCRGHRRTSRCLRPHQWGPHNRQGPLQTLQPSPP